MPRRFLTAAIGACALAISCATVLADDAPAPANPAASAPAARIPLKKSRTARRVRQVWHGYGYLPGYRPPERLEWEQARARGPQYWYGYPRFYHGRWNGGGFGPCWTQTPIGNHWNCG